MKVFSAVLKPAAVIMMFAMLYGVSLPFRPLFAPDEYDFAVRMMHFFPEISGLVSPKLPALAATMLCAGVIWTTAAKMKIFRPWSAAVIYLLLPPVWFYGTAALPVQIVVLSISLTVMLLYFARKSNHKASRACCSILAIAAALGTALLGKSDFFSWAAVPMALLPILSLHAAAKLERLDDRNRAEKVLDRIGGFLAFLLLFALALLLAAPLCRCFNCPCPEFLIFYPPGKRLFIPAMALIVPLLWFFMSSKAAKSTEKLLCIAAGVAFVLLALPPSLPWHRFLHDLPGRATADLAKELGRSNAEYFADRNYDAVIAYEWRVPVTVFGRRDGELHPEKLKDVITRALKKSDVIIALSSNNYDTFLPRENRIVYTSGSNRRIIRYSGGKK